MNLDWLRIDVHPWNHQFATPLISGSSFPLKQKENAPRREGMGNHEHGRHKPPQEQDYFLLRAEHPLCLQQPENKIWIFEIFGFYLANKVDHTNLKWVEKKENISLPFLLSCSLIAELKELAEGGSDFQGFTFSSASPSSIPSGLKTGQFHLLHYQLCQYLGWKGLQGTLNPQPDTLDPNTHTEGSVSSTSSTL